MGAVPVRDPVLRWAGPGWQRESSKFSGLRPLGGQIRIRERGGQVHV